MSKEIKIKVWHLVIILALIFLGAGIGGQEVGSRMIKKEVAKLRSKADSLQSDNRLLKIRIKLANDRLNELKDIENGFKQQLLREKNKRIKAEAQFMALRDTIFSIHFLDSLADNYRFKRNKLPNP